jgi:Ca-activated chloride channel family protein
MMLIIAMARPQATYNSRDLSVEGIDIILVIDASASMETADFQPNRLEVAKTIAQNFIKQRKNDRIGIVLFAEDAFSYAPLTLDYELLKQLIQGISTGLLPKQGTAVGSGIAVATNRLRESKSPSKVIILATDGASNKGQIDPVAAANLAKTYGIKIYTIGIGKPEYIVHVPFQGPQVQKTDLDEPVLQEMARITGGQFFRSTDEKALQEIFDKISQMERVQINEAYIREVEDIYPAFLEWGLFFLVAGWLLTFIGLSNWMEE